MINLIGPSETNNFPRMRFGLQPVADFWHLFRMKWMSTINNCPWWMLWPPVHLGRKNKQKVSCGSNKILETSKVDSTNSDSNAIPKVQHKKKSRTSVLTTHKQQGKKTPIIKVFIITECCAVSLECLSTSISHISHKIALDTGTTSNPSRKAYEEA